MSPPERPADIVVLGGYNLDISYRVRSLPKPGETSLSLGRMEAPGGKGANQAIQAARCGASTAMIAAIGQDAAGDEALRVWASAGIDTRGVARMVDPAIRTGQASIFVDAAGENMIVVDPGANAHLSPDHVEAVGVLVTRAKVVIAQLETSQDATVTAFRLAKAVGAATLLNAAPASSVVDPSLLPLTDFLVVNEVEARQLIDAGAIDEIGRALARRVSVGVIVTLGAAGALFHSRAGAVLSAPSHPVDVVDTTGAGDAFIGAFAARWVRSGDAAASLEWGVAAGALACTRPGAVDSLADGATIEALARSEIQPASALGRLG